MEFGLCGGRRLRTILSGVPYSSAEETKIIGEVAGALHGSELSVLSEFIT